MWTGNRYFFPLGTMPVPSKARPPAVASRWRCGWKPNSRVQVCSTSIRPGVAFSLVRNSFRRVLVTARKKAP
jgi:hypothetical protein